MDLVLEYVIAYARILYFIGVFMFVGVSWFFLPVGFRLFAVPLSALALTWLLFDNWISVLIVFLLCAAFFGQIRTMVNNR